MAELADALDSGSSGATRTGSSPATRTNKVAFVYRDKGDFFNYIYLCEMMPDY